MIKWRNILLFVLLLTIPIGCVQKDEVDTQNSVDFDLLGDIYLYEYKYDKSELPENYKKDTDNDYYLFITSIDVQNMNISIDDSLSIEIKDLNYYGERILELEDNHSLTVDILSDKVEVKPKKQYNCFIYRIKEGITNLKLRTIYIEYKNQTIEKNIDMLMTL